MAIDISLLIDPTKYDQIDYTGNQHHVLEGAQNAAIRALVALIQGTGPFSGSGSPEGVLTASPGATYTDVATDPPAFWTKMSGTGNTGWRCLYQP